MNNKEIIEKNFQRIGKGLMKVVTRIDEKNCKISDFHLRNAIRDSLRIGFEECKKVLAMKDENSKNIPNSPLPWKESYDMLVKENLELMGQLAEKDKIWMKEIQEMRDQKVFFMEELKKQKAEYLEFLKEKVDRYRYLGLVCKSCKLGGKQVSVDFGCLPCELKEEIARLEGEGKEK